MFEHISGDLSVSSSPRPNTIFKTNTLYDISQQLKASQFAPALLSALSQFEDHRQNAFSAYTTSRFSCSKPYGCEGRFYRVGRPDMNPVLSREVVKGQHLLFILAQTFHSLRVLGLEPLNCFIKSFMGFFPSFSLLDIMQVALYF